MILMDHAIDMLQQTLQSVLTSVRWECKLRGRCPRKIRATGWGVCRVSRRRITLIIRLHWRVVSRRRIASSGSPRVSQISGWSRVRRREVSRWGLGRIGCGEVGGSMVGRWCSLGDLCLWVLWRWFCFTV